MSGTIGTKQWLWLHKEDNVAMALSDFAAGAALSIEGNSVTLKDAVEYGHKFSLVAIPKGEDVIKYSETIGVASRDIAAGEHVHVHNVQSLRAKRQ